MEGNWRSTQPDASMASSMDATSGDWRNQLHPEDRQRIVNKIMETLKRHLPISVPEGLNELRKVAIRLEEKIYTTATSRSDYLQKISLKMLSMETQTRQLAPINPAISNAGGVNQNPTEPASNSSKKISPQVQGQQQFQRPNMGNARPLPQQHQSQVSQMQPDNHANQVQQIMQSPGTSLQQSVSSVQHVSMPLSTAQQSISNTLQPSSYIDSVQGVLIYELVTLSRLNRPNKRQQISSNTSIINRESYSISEEDSATKRVKVSEKVVPKETSSSHFCTGGTEKAKEPTFNCPICMCTMVSPFSTICGHIFCQDCIRAAIKRRKECPTCRARLTGKNIIHRVFLPTAD